MAKSNSSAKSRKGASEKPAKPYPDFPLFPHATKRWAKKIRGKLYYFGPWDDPDGALNKFLEKRDDLQAGRTPRPSGEARITLHEMCNAFMHYKEHQVEAGELTKRSYDDYHKSCERLLKVLGKNLIVEEIRPDDLLRVRESLAKKLGPVALGNEIGRIRVLFNFGYEEELIEKPVRYGKSFKKPAKRTLRQHKAKREAKHGKRFFEAGEIVQMLESADVHLRAMILLAINAGFGNADCGKLVFTSLDLDAAWVEFPRPKTGIERRCPLWPETVSALRDSIAARKDPADEDLAGLVFITKYGLPWFKESSTTNPISQQFRKLLVDLGLHRKGVGFYSLRHTFETIAGDTRDQVAVNYLMGHVDETMAGEYREQIADDRLRAVADHVHQWLYPATQEENPVDEAEEQAPDNRDPATAGDDNGRPILRIVG